MATSSRTAEVVVGRAGESPAYWYRAGLWNMLISADQSLGEFTLLEQTVPSGLGPPTHMHERQCEGVYVLAGEMEFVVGIDDEIVRAEPGSAVWIPKSTLHRFRVVSDEPARFLNYYTPGGFDDHVPYFGVEATSQTLPELGSEGAQLDMDHLVAGPETRGTYLQRISDIAEGTWVIPADDPAAHQ
jgi:mannose-6-phosphate isomerase-like protein (cupin superfamily)